jgi:4-hydroxy-tetrahydrodipicolinate reductase
MGREVVEAILGAGDDVTLVGAADPTFAGKTVRDALGLDSSVVIEKDLASSLAASKADVVVVFTVPASAMENIRTAMKAGTVPVVGTTGITPENLAEIRALSEECGVGAIIAPNFAIGAVLMMKVAGEVAKYLPAVEIIELHHDKKLDAPSGTSIKTAELIAAARKEEYIPTGDCDSGARGAEFGGVRIHSVRLPGFIAHQEIIFGGLGQSLTIRHDSYDRKSFMPGVLLAVRKASGLKSVVYGLENIV